MFDISLAIVNLGKRIQEARILRNITQDQLAEFCDVTPKHISAIERGTSSGSVTLLLKICNCLNITPNSLFADCFPIGIDNEIKDTIIPIDKHDIIIKYARLTNNNQKFIDSTINHIFQEQTRKI